MAITPRTLTSAQDTAAKAKFDLPKVASYYDKVHQAAWLNRTSGIWAGVGIGGVIGGIIGASASFLPFAFNFGGLPEATSLLSMTTLGAGLGTGFGLVVVPDVAVTAAAVSAGLEEKERREAMKELQRTNPAKAAAIEYERAHALEAQEAKIHSGSLPARAWKTLSKYYNVKVGAVAVALGAMVGAVLAINPYTAPALLGDSGLKLLEKGVAVASTEAIASGAAVIGTFSAMFGVKMSLVSNLVVNTAHQILSGKIFERSPEKAPAPAPEIPQPQHAVYVMDTQARDNHLETLLASRAQATAEILNLRT